MSYPDDTMLTFGQAAAYKGWHRSRVYALAKAGRLSVKFDDRGVKRVSKRELDELKPMKSGPKPR